MQIIGNKINNAFLKNHVLAAAENCNSVKAAIAYASGDPELLKSCLGNNLKLEYYGRYDKGVPVSTTILKKFLQIQSPNYTCRLIPDIFHPKVIWWEEYGVYIGSANLTSRGWYGNIELGVFLSQEEIRMHGIEEDLESFFTELLALSHPLTQEIVEELERQNEFLRGHEKAIKDHFEKSRSLKPLKPLTSVDKEPIKNKRRNRFLDEWRETLETMRIIASRVSSDGNRPSWIDPGTPTGVQADQFLHAYYYQKVFLGGKALHRSFHEKNKGNPEAALVNAMMWWKSLLNAPSDEDYTINVNAPFLRSLFKQENLKSIGPEEMIEICRKVFAMSEHSLRVNNETYGLPDDTPSMGRSERQELLGSWLVKQRSGGNKLVVDAIEYVLYGGKKEDLPDRIWDVIEKPEWKIPHFGISSIGEIVGWALPDEFPPRNGRTSKALLALGFPVRIHSE